MVLLISVLIPLVQMLTINSTVDEYSSSNKNGSMSYQSMSVVDFYYGASYYRNKFIPPNCEDDEYEIRVQIGSPLWSGTDDKVEIRLYGPNNSKSNWIELIKPAVDGFERLSNEFYCVKTENQPDFDFKKIGIRKLGNDDMHLDSINIRYGYFYVNQWIRDDTREYLFFAE